VSLLPVFGREGIPPFSRNEAHEQMGSVRPHSHRKAKRKAQLAAKIIGPPESILLTFFRLQETPEDHDEKCLGI
jgi:hypothetical protein